MPISEHWNTVFPIIKSTVISLVILKKSKKPSDGMSSKDITYSDWLMILDHARVILQERILIKKHRVLFPNHGDNCHNIMHTTMMRGGSVIGDINNRTEIIKQVLGWN
jgi:hypothetical protein